jgi:flagellum-specific peptidoglycan hydrolase FlgJ
MVYPTDKKKWGYTHILMTVMIDTYQHKVRSFTHNTSYILEQPSVVSTTAIKSILAPLSKQTESFIHQVRQDAQQLLIDGLAWLF